MAEIEAPLGRAQKRQKSRFETLGLSVRPMSDGRCLLVALPIGPAPFETLAGPLACKKILFATVGEHAIKCLRPRALFGLPILDIQGCADPTQIEWAIRQAWREHTSQLRASKDALSEIGLEARADEGGSTLSFPLPGEAPDARVHLSAQGEAILPSAGPLSGFPLIERAERVLDVRRQLGSAADLECQLGDRVSKLTREGKQRLDNERTGPDVQVSAPALANPSPTIRTSHHPKVLVVGPGLVTDESLRTSLMKQGYRIATSHSEAEALMRLAGMSPDLVVSEYALGRSDGASLVAAMKDLPGIEKIPVVLVDESTSEGRRDAARAVGAAGYLAHPPSPDRFVTRLSRLIETPGDRRFTRYNRRLSAKVDGLNDASLITEVGRGGVFLRTATEFEPHSAMHCSVTLPELGQTLRFEGEVLYCGETQGAGRLGLGIRFFDISEEDESRLIEYLAWLEARGSTQRA